MSLLWGKGEKRSMSWWANAADLTPGNRRVVSENNATHLAPLFAAIRHIVDFTSTLPVAAYRMQDDGSRARMSLPLLLRRQEALGGPGLRNWIGQFIYGLVVHGNAVGWIVDTDGFGFPTDVRWLRRQDWQYDYANKQWLVYGNPVPSSQLVHEPWIVPAGWVLGMSPLEHTASLIGAGLSAQEYADVKRGGGIPPTVLKNNRLELDNEQSETVRERAMAAFNSGRPFVTGADWDLTIPGIPPNQLNFLGTLTQVATDIASIYGIDPREVGGNAAGDMTYVNEEARTLNRAANIRPYIVRFEETVNRILPERQVVELDVDATVRADLKTRIEVQGWQVADGRLSVNEARIQEGREPVPGGDRHNFYNPAAQPGARPALEPTRSVPSSEGDTP